MQKAVFSKLSRDGFLLHDQVDDLSSVPVGKIIRLTDGSLFSIGIVKPNESPDREKNEGMLFSSINDGETWNEVPFSTPDHNLIPAPTGALICTKEGTIILAYANLGEKYFTWDDATMDAPGSILPTYVMRSTDKGKSWSSMEKLHDDWTGATRDIIQTDSGRVCFTSMKMLSHPGRHSVLTYSTMDDGKTWKPSNVLDMGGRGHHGGITESTIVELNDGRLMQYIRTNWGCFWRAESVDDGLSWHLYGPVDIKASSAPGILIRLQSGRIALVYNQTAPQGENEAQYMKGGDNIWSAVPVSNYREELSIRFTEDECKTWTSPVVLARGVPEITYPQVFEAKPGNLWITAHRFGFRVKLNELDFFRLASADTSDI
jgi:sialidase-1